MNLIPLPKSVALKNKTIDLGVKTPVGGEFAQAVKLLREYLSQYDGGDNTCVKFIKDESLSDEGYEILCEGEVVKVKAASPKGAFYAYVTIRQIMNVNDTFVCADIKDSPKYSYRGFMLDCSRHFWRKDKIKQLLDVMADLKMNVFHWH